MSLTRRSPEKVRRFLFLTCFFYVFHWIVITAKELNEEGVESAPPPMQWKMWIPMFYVGPVVLLVVLIAIIPTADYRPAIVLIVLWLLIYFGIASIALRKIRTAILDLAEEKNIPSSVQAESIQVFPTEIVELQKMINSYLDVQ